MRLLNHLLSPPTIPAAADHGGVIPADLEAQASSKDVAPTFMDVAERIGSDNEALRNLLRDIDFQFSALDNLRSSFGRVVEPLHKLANALSHEKLENAGLRGALAELRASHDALRAQYQGLESKASELEVENQLLGQDVASLKMTRGALEGDKAALAAEVATLCNSLAAVEKQLQEKANDARILGDDKRSLLDRVTTSEQRMLELGAAAAIEREKASLLDSEKASLQSSLDRALDRASQMSRQIGGFEKLLSEAGVRLEQLSSESAALDEERRSLTTARDEANHQREAEVEALTSQLNAVRSRSTAAEKQCTELRQALAEQAEELKGAETKLAAAEIARIAAEAKVVPLTTAVDGQVNNVRKLEEERLTLLERCNDLGKVAAVSGEALEKAQGKIKSLVHRIEMIKADAARNQSKAEKQIEQLKGDIDRSRMERAVAEGALDTARADFERVQQEIAGLQHQFRSDPRDHQSEQDENDGGQNG